MKAIAGSVARRNDRLCQDEEAAPEGRLLFF
jgi:hypothetical protein